MTARETAVSYATEVLGWRNVKAIGCHPDPKVEGTFLVAIEGDRDDNKGAQMALVVEGQEVTAETEISDYLSIGVLDAPETKDERKSHEGSKLLFDPGPIVATPGALEALQRNKSTGVEYLLKHAAGDWGEVCDEDKAANDEALKTGARIMSAYTLRDGIKLWIITDAEIDDEHHRQATTILLPDEY